MLLRGCLYGRREGTFFIPDLEIVYMGGETGRPFIPALKTVYTGGETGCFLFRL